MPALKALVERHPADELTIFGVDCYDSAADFRSGVERFGVTWPVAFGGENPREVGTYRVRSFPTTFLLDEEGVIRGRNLRGEALAKAVEALLGGEE